MRIFCGYLSNFWRKFTKFLLKNLIVLVFNLPIFVHIFSVPSQASIDREGKCYKFIKNKWNSHKDLIICQIVTMLSMKCSYSELVALCEKCPNTEAFLVRIFPHSDWIRRDTTDQKELRIWTLLTCDLSLLASWFSVLVKPSYFHGLIIRDQFHLCMEILHWYLCTHLKGPNN